MIINIFLVTSCNLRPCYPDVSCRDTPEQTPGYQCGKCPMGLEGDGVNCTDIDEVSVSMLRILSDTCRTLNDCV